MEQAQIPAILYILAGLVPSGFGLFCYIIRIERALVRIQVELTQLKREIPKCQPPLDPNIQ